MEAAREMYQEHILDLYKNPHNFGRLGAAAMQEKGYNPLCGDEVIMQLIIKGGKVADIKFLGRGCAISIASASLLTDFIKGKTVEEVKRLRAEDLIQMLEIPISPVRMKCALLCLETLHRIVFGAGDRIGV